MYDFNGEPMVFGEATAYSTDVQGAPNVWTFEGSDGAYNTTQVDERIKSGDVLLIPSESVAGWLDEAWPTAVTEESGYFHTLNPAQRDEHAEKIAQVLAVWIEWQGRNGIKSAGPTPAEIVRKVGAWTELAYTSMSTGAMSSFEIYAVREAARMLSEFATQKLEERKRP